MNMRRGIRRAAVFLTILYWAVAASFALHHSSGDGVWGVEEGMGWMVRALMLYGVLFGVGWTLYGFAPDPRKAKC